MWPPLERSYSMTAAEAASWPLAREARSAGKDSRTSRRFKGRLQRLGPYLLAVPKLIVPVDVGTGVPALAG